jgi:hypothetical protein
MTLDSPDDSGTGVNIGAFPSFPARQTRGVDGYQHLRQPIEATPPAKIGAIVESAATDMKRLAPKAAKTSDPAAKAWSPVSGGMPASRAVAN